MDVDPPKGRAMTAPLAAPPVHAGRGALPDRGDAGHRRQVELVAMTIVLLNVFDVLVTRLVLRTHPASHEGNGLLARFILSRWVWLPKAGIPLVVLVTSAWTRVTRVSYVAIFTVAGIYWAVVIWNVHILFR